MTGAFWRCAVLAALFAVHPLQVDTVAWVAERKNLLSALFWLLTTWAYVRLRARVQSPESKGQSLVWADVGAVRIGPDVQTGLVTLPFVLLLLDYWPLRRFQPQLATFNSQPSDA